MLRIMFRNSEYSREWEEIDTAENMKEAKYLIKEYKIAYGAGNDFKTLRQYKKRGENNE